MSLNPLLGCITMTENKLNRETAEVKWSGLYNAISNDESRNATKLMFAYEDMMETDCDIERYTYQSLLRKQAKLCGNYDDYLPKGGSRMNVAKENHINGIRGVASEIVNAINEVDPSFIPLLSQRNRDESGNWQSHTTQTYVETLTNSMLKFNPYD